jgi:hypothetical protein
MDIDLKQIIMIVVGLAVVWVVLRLVLKLAKQVFACGCTVIIAIGVFLFLLPYVKDLLN